MIDFSSPTWNGVREWAEATLQQVRQKNDGNLDISETANLRGRIGMLKELLGLPRLAEAQAAMERPLE